jgi:DNA-binding NtrC family response regulator
MRREMSTLKKQMEDVQVNKPAQQPQFPSTQLAPIQPISTPSLVDAEAEEYVEPEMESLNLSDLGRQMLEKALERNGGNRKKAAQELGISDRTLYRRLKQYGLDK